MDAPNRQEKKLCYRQYITLFEKSQEGGETVITQIKTGSRERGRECAVALKRCPLFDICRGNKGFWEDVEKIEVNGGWDDAKNG